MIGSAQARSSRGRVAQGALEGARDLPLHLHESTLICDKGFAGRQFETLPGEYGITMLRPSCKREKARYGEPLLKKVRQ